MPQKYALATILWVGYSLFSGLVSAQNVVTWHNDNGRTGQNLNEAILTPAKLTTGQHPFGKLFSQPVDGQIYTQPLYLYGLSVNGVSHNVVFVATENDSVYAFDADSNSGVNSAPLWHDIFVDNVSTFPVPCGDDAGSCNVFPQIGITGTPVIDTSTPTPTMYLVARTKEVMGTGFKYVYKLHALNTATGTERPGSPAIMCSQPTGSGCQFKNGNFNPQQTSQRPGLLLVPGAGPNGHSVIYMGFAGTRGWLLAYDATTLKRLADFNTTPGATLGGIWGSGGGISADASGNVFAVTGDATFNPAKNQYGETVLKLNLSFNTQTSSYQFNVLDYFTPNDYVCRTTGSNDVDLGSGGAMVLPAQLGSHPNEVVASGKGATFTGCDGAQIYLVDADTGSMGHVNGQLQQVTGENIAPGGFSGGFWSNPAYLQAGTASLVFYSGLTQESQTGDFLRAYNLVNGQFAPSASVAQTANSFLVGSTPAVSAKGSKGLNAIVWAIERQENLTCRPNGQGCPTGQTGLEPAVLHAYDPTKKLASIYSSADNAVDTAGSASKFQVPTIANGKVYLATQTELDVYGLF
jgi:hypothetical protein